MFDLLHKMWTPKYQWIFLSTIFCTFSTWNMILTQTMDSHGNYGPNSLEIKSNSNMQPEYKKIVIFLYMVYNQIWLNLLIDDRKFGYIIKLKRKTLQSISN